MGDFRRIFKRFLLYKIKFLLVKTRFLGLEVLSKEEWIVFRKKMYRLDDFLMQWKEKLQNATNSPLASRILQEIHKYEVQLLYITFLI